MNNNIVLLSLSTDEFAEIIRNVVNDALKEKKQKELLDFKETCLLLGISSSTLNKLKRENRIPYKKIGKRILFSREEVLKSLKDSNYSKLRAIV
jgi:excisionase family DNA binding protein